MTGSIHPTRIAAAFAVWSMAGAAMAATAEAQHMTETRRINVSYSDLDLSRQADVTAMVERLNVAANRACGSLLDTSVAMRRQVSKCRAAALQDAIQTIAAPLLTASFGADPAYSFASR